MKISRMRLIYSIAIMLLACAGMASIVAAQSSNKSKAQAKDGAAKSLPTKGKLDLNAASEQELNALPGVGPVTAKKIVAGRPYSSVDELSKAGLSARTVNKITPLVTVGSGAAATVNAKTRRPEGNTAATRLTTTGTAPPTKSSPIGASRGDSGPGMVWVDTFTKVYHRQGDQWYGKTKQGKYMTEDDAIKAGYQASKQGGGKK